MQLMIKTLLASVSGGRQAGKQWLERGLNQPRLWGCSWPHKESRTWEDAKKVVVCTWKAGYMSRYSTASESETAHNHVTSCAWMPEGEVARMRVLQLLLAAMNEGGRS